MVNCRLLLATKWTAGICSQSLTSKVEGGCQSLLSGEMTFAQHGGPAGFSLSDLVGVFHIGDFQDLGLDS